MLCNFELRPLKSPIPSTTTTFFDSGNREIPRPRFHKSTPFRRSAEFWEILPSVPADASYFPKVHEIPVHLLLRMRLLFEGYLGSCPAYSENCFFLPSRRPLVNILFFPCFKNIVNCLHYKVNRKEWEILFTLNRDIFCIGYHFILS